MLDYGVKIALDTWHMHTYVHVMIVAEHTSLWLLLKTVFSSFDLMYVGFLCSV